MRLLVLAGGRGGHGDPVRLHAVDLVQRAELRADDAAAVHPGPGDDLANYAKALTDLRTFDRYFLNSLLVASVDHAARAAAAAR